MLYCRDTARELRHDWGQIMQNDHSGGGVLTGLIFSTIFLLAIGSLSWAPRMRIVEGALVTTHIVVPAIADAPAVADARAGYGLASESSMPVKLAPRRGFAHRSRAWSAAGTKPWRRADAFAARKLPRPRT
jgi:hypothetical protein